MNFVNDMCINTVKFTPVINWGDLVYKDPVDGKMKLSW
jgi:hypothetical protein